MAAVVDFFLAASLFSLFSFLRTPSINLFVGFFSDDESPPLSNLPLQSAPQNSCLLIKES